MSELTHKEKIKPATNRIRFTHLFTSDSGESKGERSSTKTLDILRSGCILKRLIGKIDLGTSIIFLIQYF